MRNLYNQGAVLKVVCDVIDRKQFIKINIMDCFTSFARMEIETFETASFHFFIYDYLAQNNLI